MGNKRIAREIMLVAKSLLAYDEAQIAKDIKTLKNFKDDFEKKNKTIYDQVKELQKQIDEIDAKKSELEKHLKDNFKVFDKEVGIKKLSKQASEALAEGMRLGKSMDQVVSVLDSIQDGIVAAKISQQPAYKAAWEVLVSMLNGSEYDVYVKALDGLFKKNIAEIKTANKLFDSTAKSFNGDFERTYNERKKEWDSRHPERKMPELSKLSSSRNQVRVAGILDWFADFTGWIAKTYKQVAKACSSAIKNLFGLKEDASKLNGKLGTLLKAANKVKSNIR